MKLNFIIIIIALAVLSVTSLFDNNYLAYSSPIPYSQWQKISFTDFKGLKKPEQTLYGNSEFAFIKTSRTIDLLQDDKLAVTTYFYPSRSYVYDQDIRSNDLLRHELYHLHITEYCSRLFRKDISVYNYKDACGLLSMYKEKYARLENTLQAQYDDDSYHSYVLSEQKRWENRIDSSLQSLKDFSDSVVYLKK